MAANNHKACIYLNLLPTSKTYRLNEVANIKVADEFNLINLGKLADMPVSLFCF